MSKRTPNCEVTSKKAASTASKVLRDPKSSKAAKSFGADPASEQEIIRKGERT